MTTISKDIIITVESVEESTKPECPICYEDLNSKNTTKLNPCAHLLCKTCEKTLKKTSEILRCPLCRTLIEKPEEPKKSKKYSVCEWIEFIFVSIFVILCTIFYFGVIGLCIYGIVLGGFYMYLGAAFLIIHYISVFWEISRRLWCPSPTDDLF